MSHYANNRRKVVIKTKVFFVRNENTRIKEALFSSSFSKYDVIASEINNQRWKEETLRIKYDFGLSNLKVKSQFVLL